MKKMRKLNYFIGVLLLVGIAQSSIAQVGYASEAEIKIATWNIEHLRAEINEGIVKRSTQDYERLKGYAERLDADVIALQEVDGAEAAQRVFDPNEYNFYFSDRNNVMLTGFAIKKDIEVFQHEDYEALDVNGNGGLRYGTDVTIIIGEDSLRLMSIHLKSRCWEGSLGGSASSSCDKLRRQMDALEDWIDERAVESIPFIVLGDYNRRFDVEGDEFWPEIDDSVPENADLHNVTEGLRSKCWNSQYPLYIDHIVLDKRATELLVADSFEQICFDNEDAPYKDKLSDHCPISVVLDIQSISTPPCECTDLVLRIEQKLVELQELLNEYNNARAATNR